MGDNREHADSVELQQAKAFKGVIVGFSAGRVVQGIVHI
jgi:hypothetical protein